MKTKLILAVIGCALAACGGKPRHVMTDKDVEAVKVAQANGDTEWTDTESQTHELTCIYQFPAPLGGGCLEFARTPPAGAFDCGTDTFAYGGEFLFSDRQNFAPGGLTGHVNCAGYNHGSNPGGLPGLGDYNDIAVAVKNNTGVEIHGYRDANFGQNVQFFPSNGQTVNNLSSPYNAQMSSFRH
jgi:hypothetical protein